MPMLKTLAATMEQLQVYDRSVHRIAREDEIARHTQTAPGVGTIVALGYMTGVENSIRGYEASLILRAAGFERVQVLDGGTAMWPFETVTGRT